MSFTALLFVARAVTFAVVGVGVYLATRNYYDPPNEAKP